MEIKYRSYWASVKKLQTEVQLIGRLDLLNKTRYKKKYEAGNITAREIAELNHGRGLQYELSVFKDDELYCHIILIREFMEVNFINHDGHRFVSYLFSPSRKLNNMFFIREVWYYNYLSGSEVDESYRIHFVFDEDGNVNYRKYDEVKKKFFDYESKESADITGLYEPFPEFEKYESLIRLERDFPIGTVPYASELPNDND